MGKNLVVFSDGTGQDGGVRPDQRLSNVYKLFRSARVGPDSLVDPALQIAFYDPGLGTDDDVHGFGRLWRSIGKFLASVAGRGIGANIADCYEFLLNHWRPGDRIYLVGFSRGAYTARCVAQVVTLCGIPTHEAERPDQPFRRFARSTRAAAERAVHQVYEHGAGHPIAKFEAERDEQARRFRADYGSSAGEGSNAYPYFVGVFDTVAALGAKGWKYWGLVAGFVFAAILAIAVLAGVLDLFVGIRFGPTFLAVTAAAAVIAFICERRSSRREIRDFPEKGDRHVHHVSWHAKDYDRGLSGHVGFARHAKAIDEDRADFPHVPWGRASVVRRQVEGEPPPLVQLWFAGNHSDVGGSYAEVESRLSDVALEWMLEEAASLPEPMLFDRRLLTVWPDAGGMQHSEVQAVRDGRLWWVPRWAPAWLREGWPYAERPASGGPVHPSVHWRFAVGEVVQGLSTGPYRPHALRTDARFAHFYDGTPAASAETLAAAARWRLTCDGCGILADGAAAPDLDRFLASKGASEAIVVTVVGPTDPRDDYAVGLVLRELDRALASTGMQSLPVAADVEGLVGPVGRLVLQVSSADGRSIARSSGRPWFLTIASGGSARVVPAFD